MHKAQGNHVRFAASHFAVVLQGQFRWYVRSLQNKFDLKGCVDLDTLNIAILQRDPFFRVIFDGDRASYDSNV